MDTPKFDLPAKEPYGLNPEAGLTVLFYRGLEVKSSRAYGAKDFTKSQVSPLLDDVSKILKSP